MRPRRRASRASSRSGGTRRYQPGRRVSDWRKVKVRQGQELVIVGYTKRPGPTLGRLRRRSSLAVNEAGGLRWAGNVGTGFSDAEIDRLLKLLRPLRRNDSPLAETPKMPRVRNAATSSGSSRSSSPRSTFAEWTHEGRLRAPVYLGLREDKHASDVRRERTPMPTVLRKGRRELRCRTSTSRSGRRRGSRRATCSRTTAMSRTCSCPHLRDRPFTMKRYPDGWQGKHFFQKQAPSHMPEWIPRVPFPASTREGEKKIIDYAARERRARALVDGRTWAASTCTRGRRGSTSPSARTGSCSTSTRPKAPTFET